LDQSIAGLRPGAAKRPQHAIPLTETMPVFDSTARKQITPEPTFRAAPHNIEAEQALLGAILVNNEAFYRVSDFLEPKHFFEPIHQRIFELAGGLVRMGKIATPVTLKTFLPGDTDVAGLSANQYLARLAAEATTIINAEDYGRTIYDLSVRRDLIAIGEDVVNLAYDAPVDMHAGEQIEIAERRLYEVAESGHYGRGFESFSNALTRSLDMAAAAHSRDGRLSGLATGLATLDRQMGGLQPSDLIILAGRPGMGKTALATNIAYDIASNYESQHQPDGRKKTISGGIVGFFSLEMSAEQLATRIISHETQIPSNAIRRGDIKPFQYDAMVDATRNLQNTPLYIDDSGGLTIAQLASRARRLKRQRGLDLLVIDYIQLLQGTTRRSSENRVQEVTEITTKLKALAKELNVPIIALSQLSRQVESRDDKRPQLSDLRESGSIEQDADVVLFVFREAYYLKNREPAKIKDNLETPEHKIWEEEYNKVKGVAEVIVAKQRHGPTGTVPLQFEGEFTRFTSLAVAEELPERIRDFTP
jgi:replicative DNA helicase